MPPTPLMTWNDKTKRWFKKYKTHQYAVSCKSLGTPATRNGSVRAANQWWFLKKMEIDNKRPMLRAYQADCEHIVQILRAKAAWLSKHRVGTFLVEHVEGLYKRMAALVALMPKEDRAQYAERAGTRIAKLRQATPKILDTSAEERMLFLDLADFIQQQIDSGGELFDPQPLIDRFPEVFDVDVQWRDRLIYTASEAPAHERAVGAQVNRWLEMQEARARAGKICKDRYSAYDNAITAFQEWVGANNCLEVITGELLETYKIRLLQQVAGRASDPTGTAGMTLAYANEQMNVAIHFVKWLCRQDLIAQPKLAERNALRIRVKRRDEQERIDTS